MAILVDHELCVACGACLGACPTNCLSIEGESERRLVIQDALCAECAACIPACPTEALSFGSDNVERKHVQHAVPDLSRPYEPPPREPPRPATRPDPIDPEHERFDPLSWRPGGGLLRRTLKRKLGR